MRNHFLVEQGLARWYRGRLIPVMRGGAEDEDSEAEAAPLFASVPALYDNDGSLVKYDLEKLDDEALAGLIESYETTIAAVTANPTEFVSADFTAAELLDETAAAVAALKAMKADAATRAEPAELSDADRAAFDALAALSNEEPEADADADDEDEPADEVEAPADEASAADDKTFVASAPRRGPLPRPAPDREPAQHEPALAAGVSLVAAGGAHDMLPGTQFGSELELAEAMINRHRQFGMTGPGTVEKYAIAKADWKDAYPAERKLRGTDEIANFDVIKPVIDQAQIKRALRDRIHEVNKDMSLTASGGLCAPVTPYYNLQYISVPTRPVMGSLPSFNADRGGLRYARPAALSAVTTAVGIITEHEDAEGGTFATKTCQVISCPPFQETDVDTIYHCLQFGNLGARAFPELVAQWNNLVLAAHARLAESNLLTHIDAFSTQVTASAAVGLGATGQLFSQILAAANGMRSRHRMDPEAVLRLMLPDWSIDLLISDVIRSQFQRFDTDEAKVIALLRSFDIEPTFYIDSANGRQQVFGTQSAGALLAFPTTVTWYLFPEGSFLYLDSGTLELGIVRDSVLNKTNDFQIFGETFENVAFVGVESLAVVSTVCDSGTVSLPHAVTCPISYA